MFSDKKKLSASATSSAALEGSASDLKQPDLFGPSLSVSRTSSAKQSCESTGLKRQSTTTCEPSTQIDLEELTSSSVGFLASPGAKPGSKEARQMTVTSGRKWLGLLQSYGLHGSLARTCEDLLTNQWASSAAFLTWKASGIKPSHLLFQLAPSMPRTDATGSGWWPTPTASDHKGSGRTIIRKDGKNRLNDRLDYATEQREPNGGQLNPTWVEWLMGFPTGWTDLKPSEMPSSPDSSNKSAER